MKLYERIENNNFEEIDRNRAIELIEGGNGHLVYNENYFKLQKENEELKEIYKSEKKMKNEYVKLYQDLLLKENVIPVQKVKDKIEELQENQRVNKFEIELLQELIEGEK